ncbi:MAG TPA: SRPBCC domain-containing protein [Blastocatellia bacterium]|nr:SRPBCC domain-containing protein [Blastocatellia bacterium]
MSEISTPLPEAPDRSNGKGRPEAGGWSQGPAQGQVTDPFRPPSPDQIERDIPRLHTPGAMPVVRDRWERLVTTVEIPSPPDEVWRALTDPAALRKWLAVCHGSLEVSDTDCVLDFEDGEFFLCRSKIVDAPNRLQYYWRWLGIGQATSVDWNLQPSGAGTRVTVTEEAWNAPWDWQTWNGGGWPGILDQLAAYLRTGMEWRWPWRRMGPYAQVELPQPIFMAWDRLFNPSALKYWLLSTHGSIAPNEVLPIILGDASGMVEMVVHEVVQPGQTAPSFLPYVTFSLRRKVWQSEVGGRLWIEPAGWGRSVFQVFHYNWENLPPGIQLSERRLLANFWAGVMQRAQQLCTDRTMPTSPHNWS